MWNENIPLLEINSRDDIKRTDEVPCVIVEENEICTGNGDLEMSNDDHGKSTDIQTILLENKTRRSKICAEGPELPEGKLTHLFVSYSNHDNDRVLQIVAVLERKFGLRCIVADRDFHSGKTVMANIESGMEASAKILLFVSPNFLRSKYCKYEQSLAFVMSLDNAENIVIPVKLEECEIPKNLRTLTYVDATKDIQNVPNRIMKVFNDQDEYLPLHFAQEKQKLENGFFTDFMPKKEEYFPCVSLGRPRARTFEVDQIFIKKIRESKIKATEEVLQAAVDLINEHNRSHFCSKVDFVCFPCCFCCCTSVVLYVGICLVFLLMCLQIIDTREPSQKAADVDTFSRNSFGILIFIFCPIMCCVLSCLNGYYGRKAAKTLDNKLFDTITAFTYTDGLLCSIFYEHNGICLGLIKKVRLIRYNVKPCEEYLTRRIKAHRNKLTLDGINDTPQKTAQKMVKNFLRLFLKQNIGGNLQYYPDAPENRHNVKGGKMCICQILEQKLPPTVPLDEEAA